MTGLIAADAGAVRLDGVDVTKLPMYQRSRMGVGYLPQEASIFRGLNVEQNIMAALEVVEPDADGAVGEHRQAGAVEGVGTGRRRNVAAVAHVLGQAAVHAGRRRRGEKSLQPGAQLRRHLLVGVERHAILDCPDRANGTHVCPLRAQEGVQVQPLGVIQRQLHTVVLSI